MGREGETTTPVFVIATRRDPSLQVWGVSVTLIKCDVTPSLPPPLSPSPSARHTNSTTSTTTVAWAAGTTMTMGRLRRAFALPEGVQSRHLVLKPEEEEIAAEVAARALAVRTWTVLREYVGKVCVPWWSSGQQRV